MPRVYIGRLGYSVREKDVQRFFGGYGRLLEVDMKYGYGFVEFEDCRDADDAVYELNGRELCGERVVVEHARGSRRAVYNDLSRSGGGGEGEYSRPKSGREKYGPLVHTEYRLTVQNLSSRCNWQDLKDFMRQAGEVTFADAHKEYANEGVIEFRSQNDMKRALEKLDGTIISGRKIKLVETNKLRRPRFYSGKRSRLRSRSRRRSHSRSRRSSRSSSRSPVKAPPLPYRSRNEGRSRSRSKSRKSRSRSIPKSDIGSPSRSRSKANSELSRSRPRSLTPRENGREVKSKSRSPSKSRSRSYSRSPLPESFMDRDRSESPSPKTASRSQSRSKSRSKSSSRSRSMSRD